MPLPTQTKVALYETKRLYFAKKPGLPRRLQGRTFSNVSTQLEFRHVTTGRPQRAWRVTTLRHPVREISKRARTADVNGAIRTARLPECHGGEVDPVDDGSQLVAVAPFLAVEV